MTLVNSGALINFGDGSTQQGAGTGASSEFTTKESISTRDFLVTNGGSVKVQRPQYDWRRAFHTATTNSSDSSKYDQTDYAYTYWSSTNTDVLYIVPKTVTSTLPVVTTATNGSNAANQTVSYLRKDGTVAFSKSADGIFSYRQYTNGQLTKSIQDAQTNHGSDFASGDDPNTDFGITETGDGLRLVTTYTYDAQGRPDTTTAPDGEVSKMWYTKLSDGRMVTLSIPRMVAGGSTTHYGPVSYSVTNHAGKPEFTGTIALSGGATTTALTSWITSSADPITTVYNYDAAGRKTAVIANYVDGTPGGGTNGDEDQVTRYEYTNGLQTKIIADLVGSSDDQETIYTYGVTKGASVPDSKISSNRLLHTVQYPDSSGGSDVVTYAYNAQSQQIYMKDQLGTETASTYDTAGRLLHKGLTSVAGSLDASVRRISSAYDTRGMKTTVTQYDNATPGSGSVVDEVKYTYDDWGNMTQFEQDRDSAVSGGGNQYSIGYTYAKNSPTSGVTMLRRSTMTLPDASTLTYEYGSANSIADDQSRVADIKLGSTIVAAYSYLGDFQLVGTNLPEPNVSYNLYGPSSADDYARMDRFGRTISSRWDNTGGSNTAFYDVELAYDRNSNITLTEDKIQHNGGANETFSAQYSMDNLNRLIRAEEGNWSGSVINNRTRDEQWTLSPTGNFSRRKIDLNGDGDFVDTNEIDDTGTFNKANEWLTRDTDSNGSTNYTLTHDAVGQLTDDGKDYKFKYDGFGRLKEVRNQSNNLVAEYRYNGLGYRIGWHYDANASGAVDGSDPWYYFAYDERWRPVATYRGSDTSPKEQFVFHAAGRGGMGGSSYIDSVVLRDKDANTAWTSAADGTLEDRIYYCQNWRNDVSVLVKPDGGNGLEVVEWIKYSAYGVPYCIAAADYNRSGATDTADSTAFDTDFNNTNARADVNFDGTVDLADFFAFYNGYGTGEGGGRDVATRRSVGNRIIYSGYQWDPAISSYHARNRVYQPALAVWLSRDPAGYTLDLNLYGYVANAPMERYDPMGLAAKTAIPSKNVKYCLACCGPPPCCGACDDIVSIDIGDNNANETWQIISGGTGIGPPRFSEKSDVLRLECNQIPAFGFLNFRHCFVSCETTSDAFASGWPAQNGKKLMTWSLQATDFLFGNILYIQGTRDGAYPVDNPATATPEFYKVGVGLCERGSQLMTNDQHVLKYRSYSYDSCNSNWYAKSFWFRMLGEAPRVPNAEYQDRCCKSLYQQDPLSVPSTYFGRSPNSFCVDDSRSPGNCDGVKWSK